MRISFNDSDVPNIDVVIVLMKEILAKGGLSITLFEKSCDEFRFKIDQFNECIIGRFSIPRDEGQLEFFHDNEFWDSYCDFSVDLQKNERDWFCGLCNIDNYYEAAEQVYSSHFEENLLEVINYIKSKFVFFIPGQVKIGDEPNERWADRVVYKIRICDKYETQ